MRARGESAAAAEAVEAAVRRRAERAEREREATAAGLELALHQELDRALTDLRTDLNATLRPDLSELASGFLRDLTNGRYTDLELDEDYGATLLDDGDPKAVISGGEEDIANLALRLAISQMIAERAGQPLSLLILDEIFGSLDEDRRAAVVDLLRSLADRFPQVILITHIDSVREGFDRVVRVGYRPGQRGGDGAGRAAGRSTMWRPDRSVRGPERPTLRDIELAQPGLRRRVHRPLQPGRAGGRARAAAQHPGLALRAGGCRRRRDGLARCRRPDGRRSTWCTAPGPKAGWARSPCGPTARARDSGRPWCDRASTGSGRRAPRTIGLETMPRTVDNIGFYSRIGLVPGPSHRHPGARRAAPGGGRARAAVSGGTRLAARGSRSAGG